MFFSIPPIVWLLTQPGTLFDIVSIMPLYLGPETIMPIASIFAAILGILLMFWRLLVRAIKQVVLPNRSVQPDADEAPLTAVELPEETETKGPVA